MMIRTVFSVVFGLLSASVYSADPAMMPKQHYEVFENYCLDCHDSETAKGEIDLESLDFEISKDIKNAETWQKVLDALNTGEMPPEKKDQLSNNEKTAILGDLSVQMVLARKILSDSGGEIALRRLNRREYANTLEILLGVRPDITGLPDDQATTAGFDTAGASLFFSSDQLEQYLATARKSLELALLSKPSAKVRTARVEPEEFFTPHYAEAAAELKDQMERAEKYFAQSEKPPSAFGFLDEYQVKKQRVAEWYPLLKQYGERPETKTGATLIMTIKQGGTTKIKLPTLGEREEGSYTIRLRAAAYPDAAERFHYLEFTSGYGTGRNLLGWRKVTGTLENPQIIEFPIEHQRGERQQVWVHQRTHQDRGDKNLATIDNKENGFGTPPGLWVDWAEIEGPVADPRAAELAAQILFERPAGMGEDEYAKEVMRRFAAGAFRTAEPESEFLDRLFERYTANVKKGQPQAEALIGPLSIILSSPSFLYLVESTSDGASNELGDLELAVRLAYFLWSAPPDEELMELARRGELAKPEVLQAQTTRLLADRRADHFVRGFVHQWLELERLDMFQFDGVTFPTFDNAVRENSREEIFHTFHTLLVEKLPLGKLLKSEFIVVNDLMAEYYGVPAVEGHEFRKVAVAEDSLRGGLLGSAAVLAMGSDGLRSSPVERGAWVLRHLLNKPPPPAPPNVPQLGRLAGQVLSARQLIGAHTEEAQCRQCHQKIDPVGFGLENFDAAGQWREVEVVTAGATKQERRGKRPGEFPIDASGALPGGKGFANYFEMRDALGEFDDEFARGFTESLIAYGLGRPFGFTDQDLADEIVGKAHAGNYQPHLFIHALVQSQHFKTK